MRTRRRRRHARAEPIAGLPRGARGRAGRARSTCRLARLRHRPASCSGPTPSPSRAAPRPPPPRGACCRRTARTMTDVARHLRPGPALGERRCTTARASCSTARATSSSPPASTSRPRTASRRRTSHAQYGKVIRLNPDGDRARGQPLRRPLRGGAGRLVLRPPQHPGRGARRPTGRSGSPRWARWGATSCSRSQPGPNYGWPEVSLRPQLRRLARRHRRAPGRGLRGADLLLGPGDRAGRHGLLRRRAVPGLAGRPADRLASTPAASCGSRWRRAASRARSGCCPTLGRVRDVEELPRRLGPAADRRARAPTSCG